jgi:hypothetical protein
VSLSWPVDGWAGGQDRAGQGRTGQAQGPAGQRSGRGGIGEMGGWQEMTVSRQQVDVHHMQISQSFS